MSHFCPELGETEEIGDYTARMEVSRSGGRYIVCLSLYLGLDWQYSDWLHEDYWVDVERKWRRFKGDAPEQGRGQTAEYK